MAEHYNSCTSLSFKLASKDCNQIKNRPPDHPGNQIHPYENQSLKGTMPGGNVCKVFFQNFSIEDGSFSSGIFFACL